MSLFDEFIRRMEAVYGAKLNEKDFPPLNPSPKPNSTLRSSSHGDSPANSKMKDPLSSQSSSRAKGTSSSSQQAAGSSSQADAPPNLHGVDSSSTAPPSLHGASLVSHGGASSSTSPLGVEAPPGSGGAPTSSG